MSLHTRRVTAGFTTCLTALAVGLATVVVPSEDSALVPVAVAQEPAHSVELVEATSEVRLEDEAYGAVQILTYTVKNLGTSPIHRAEVVAPNGLNFVDNSGEIMYTGLTDGMFPLEKGETATLRTFRLLTDEELAAGKTKAQEIRFNFFGPPGDRSNLVSGGIAPVTDFQPAQDDTTTEPKGDTANTKTPDYKTPNAKVLVPAFIVPLLAILGLLFALPKLKHLLPPQFAALLEL